MSNKQFTNEVKELNSSIILEKCNSKAPEYRVYICNMSNIIIDIFETHFSKEVIKKQLQMKGFEICKRKDATNYVSTCKTGSDTSDFNLWLKK